MEDIPSQGLLNRLRSLARRLKTGNGIERFEEEIQDLIEQGAEKGVISAGEGEMIQSIFEFKDTIAREIMVPRTAVIGVSREASLGEALELIIKTGHSRLPVYTGDIDHIVGVLHAKDLLGIWGRPTEDPMPDELVRTPIFIPEGKKIVELLGELRGKKNHLAVILDEYGGTAGLITLEDIIEEIIGEIRDEYDDEEDPVVRIDDETVLVDARMNLEELEDFMDYEFPEGDYETVGGFITDLLGRVPDEGEQIEFRNLLLTIKVADERKIDKVEIKRLPPNGNLNTNAA